MRLVVDANVLLAGLLRTSSTRALLLDPRLDLYAPEHLIEETEKHLRSPSRFRERVHVPTQDLLALFTVLTSRITVPPQEEYELVLPEALRIAPHDEDAPYLALALALRVSLWSNDAGMRTQHAVPVITTTELIRQLKQR